METSSEIYQSSLHFYIQVEDIQYQSTQSVYIFYALYLTLEIESRTVADTFEHSYRTTCDTFSQLIQFKLVHNRVMTSKLLNEMDLVPDQLCVHCSKVEAIEQLNVANLWRFVEMWIRKHIDKHAKL